MIRSEAVITGSHTLYYNALTNIVSPTTDYCNVVLIKTKIFTAN